MLAGLLPVPLAGHSLQAEIDSGSQGTVAVRYGYGGGGPASAEVMLVSPADPTRYHRVLRTDSQGVVRFVPDTPGLWRLVADDGLGHRAELEIRVGPEGTVDAVERRGGGSRLVWGLGCLAGLLLGWLGWRWRKAGRANV